MNIATVTMTIHLAEAKYLVGIDTLVSGVQDLDQVFYSTSCNILENKLATSKIEKIIFVLPETNNYHVLTITAINHELREMIRKFQAVAEDLEIPFELSM